MRSAEVIAAPSSPAIDIKESAVNLKSAMAIATFFFSGAVWASDQEHCPAPGDIKLVGGVYSATSPGGHSWVGVVQGDKLGKVTSFDSGIFYPAKAGDTTLGQVGKCAYTTQQGGVMDLRYRPEATPGPVLKLQQLANWKKTEGPFGIEYYQCTNQKNGGCAFSEVK